MKSTVFPVVVFFALISVFRIFLVSGNLPEFSTADNPAAHHSDILVRLLTFTYLSAYNVYLLVFPQTLSYDWSMGSIPLVESFFDIRVALTVIFFYILYRLSLQCLDFVPKKHIQENNNDYFYNFKIKNTTLCTCDNTTKNRKSPSDERLVLFVSLLFLVIPFLPASNIFFYVGFVIAERILYLPSVGYCLLSGLGWQMLAKKWNKKLLYIAGVSLLLSFSIRTIRRNKDWESEESLYRSGIPVNPPKGNHIQLKIIKTDCTEDVYSSKQF